jgi:hypothetical protein
MKRIAVIAAAIAMFASTAAIALADEAAESPGDEPESSEERVLNETQMWKVNILADYWLSGEEAVDVASDGEEAESALSIEEKIRAEIEALRTGEIVVGWGAMFKLMQLAKLYEPAMSFTEVAEMIRDSDEGWAFGRRFKKLAEEREDEAELESDDDSPKNFGQLKKQYREENGTRDKKPKRP